MWQSAFELVYVIEVLFILVGSYVTGMNPVPCMEYGEDLLKDKKYQKAEAFYMDLIAKGKSLNDKLNRKDFAKAFNNLGVSLYKQVKFDEAIFNYTAALQHDNELAVAYYNRGTIHYRLGDFHLAFQDMQQAVSRDPCNKEFCIGLQESKKQMCFTE